MIDWCTKFRAFPDCHDPESIVIAGLERCVIKNDLSSLIAYLKPILDDYLKNSIITLEQVGNLWTNRENMKSAKRLPKGDSSIAAMGKTSTSTRLSKYEKFYL
ncbi:DnaD-like protein (fragment) [Candidatus Desulfosporosinus infrequens]|uniref:DnaD-like protein n=1 Tax=Candidatus Desulfosporosinus infrequens TaxID=2043169 RepID=A0A2U3K880_9FIRM